MNLEKNKTKRNKINVFLINKIDRIYFHESNHLKSFARKHVIAILNVIYVLLEKVMYNMTKIWWIQSTIHPPSFPGFTNLIDL